MSREKHFINIIGELAVMKTFEMNTIIVGVATKL